MPESELISKLNERRCQEHKIVLPSVISWEYGSSYSYFLYQHNAAILDKYASQKGSGGFNRLRNNTLNVESSREWVESYDVPFHMCPPLKHRYASQAGQPVFGRFRDNLFYVREHEEEDKKSINEMLSDSKTTARILSRWNTPNNEAKNDQIGAKRQTITTVVDHSRQLNLEEQQKCRAAVPRFQCINETMAAKDAEVNGKQPMAVGLHSNRQIVTNVNGLDRTESDQLKSNAYMSWLGGQLTLQSQAHTAGFMKKRDVANVSYYDKLINEAAQKLELQKLKEQCGTEEFENNFNLASTEHTVNLSDNVE